MSLTNRAWTVSQYPTCNKDFLYDTQRCNRPDCQHRSRRVFRREIEFESGSMKKENGSGAVATSRNVKQICVYCGSGKGRNRAYAAAARTLGKALAAHNIGLVYGGGSLGLMGEVATTTLAAGGKVTGIIPEFLSEREKMLRDVTELIVTKDMHQRKMEMFRRADAFVALPGGIGTLEELVEQLTWSQLGQHTKPIVLANIQGFWSPFLDLIDHMKQETFIREELDVRISVVDTAREIVPTVLKAAAEKPIVTHAGDVAEKF